MSNPGPDPRRVERGRWARISQFLRSTLRLSNSTLRRTQPTSQSSNGMISSADNGRRSIFGRMPSLRFQRPFRIFRNNHRDGRNVPGKVEGVGPDFNPSVPLSGSSGESVPNLTGRVIKQESLPVFEGSYSNVYKGILDGKQLVAIKALRDQRITTEDARRRFRRETGVWWHLRHDNIAPLLGYVIDQDISHYGALISLWYKNGNAVEYLKNHKDTLTVVDRLDLFHGVARGIQYLHNRDPTIVHGDLKPSNVLIDNDGIAKLCDFGLLRIIHNGAPTGTTTHTTHTGTTRYIPYEMMVEGSIPTTSSDIYALGCVGLEFTYDKLPYNHIKREHSQAGYKIGREIEAKHPPASRPSNLTPTSSRLWDMFERLWDVDATRRPDSRAVCAFLEEHRAATIHELH